MKKTFTSLLLFCLFSLPLFSANGYLRYSIKYSGPDANNPKLIIYPREIELFLSDNAIVACSGGGVLASMMGTLIWYRSKPDSLYMISHSGSTIYASANSAAILKDFSVQKSGPKQKIAGYEGTEYKVSCTHADSTRKWRMWAVSGPAYAKLPFMSHPQELSFVFQEGNYFPLKLEYEQYTHQMRLTVTLTLEEESRKKQDASIFEFPAGYKRKQVRPGEKMQIGSGG